MCHLILHKVRGEPAYDIAEPACSGPKPCQPNCGRWDGTRCSAEGEWIIPTSGHRAYPYKTWSFEELSLIEPYHYTQDIPTDWPDHYNVRKEASMPKVGLGELMAMIMPKIKRRI